MKRVLVGCILLALSLLTWLRAPTAAHASWLLPTEAPPIDLAVHESKRILYVTAGQKVLRFCTSSGQRFADIELDGNLGGVDVSADGRFLAVADRSKAGDHVRFFLVDLTDGTTQTVRYPASWDVSGVHSVAFGSDGAVYLTVSGSNWHPLRRYNIASKTTFDIMTVYANTMLAPSGDRRYVGMVQPQSPSDVFRLSVETFDVTHARAANVHRELALSTDGQRIAVPGYQFCDFFDTNMAITGRINSGLAAGFPVTAGYSAPDSVWIMPWGGGGSVRVVDASGTILPGSWTTEATFNLLHAPYTGGGRIRVTSDGAFVYITVPPRGVQVIDRRASIQLDAPARVISHSSSALLTGLVPSGTSTVSLEASTDLRTWKRVDEATTSAGCTFTVTPSERTHYRLRWPGNGLLVPSSSPPVSITPRALLGGPICPPRVVRNRRFTVQGTVKPAHTSSAPVRLLFRRWENGAWRLRKTVNTTTKPTGGTFSTYSTQVTLNVAGSWRVTAYHRDSGHAETLSPYRSIKVK